MSLQLFEKNHELVHGYVATTPDCHPEIPGSNPDDFITKNISKTVRSKHFFQAFHASMDHI